MKKEYKTPVITSEELIKQEVLLVSGDTNPNKKDDANVGGDLLSFIWNGGE